MGATPRCRQTGPCASAADRAGAAGIRRRVAVESPGLPEVSDQIRHADLTPVPLPVDGEGARVDLLDESSAEAAVLTPAHQFPTGVPLSARRRAALLDWARRADAVVLEDDYDAEFRYDRQPIAALQGLAPEQVIYAGSASKTLAPGLRLGWIIAPPTLLDLLVEERWLADRQSSGLDHLVLAELIDSADYDRHIRRARLHYRRRRDELAAALPPAIAELNGERVRAGLHALVRLPAGTSEATVVEQLALAGVAVNPLARYSSEVGPGLVIGYATPRNTHGTRASGSSPVPSRASSLREADHVVQFELVAHAAAPVSYTAAPSIIGLTAQTTTLRWRDSPGSSRGSSRRAS